MAPTGLFFLQGMSAFRLPSAAIFLFQLYRQKATTVVRRVQRVAANVSVRGLPRWLLSFRTLFREHQGRYIEQIVHAQVESYCILVLNIYLFSHTHNIFDQARISRRA